MAYSLSYQSQWHCVITSVCELPHGEGGGMLFPPSMLCYHGKKKMWNRYRSGLSLVQNPKSAVYNPPNPPRNCQVLDFTLDRSLLRSFELSWLRNQTMLRKPLYSESSRAGVSLNSLPRGVRIERCRMGAVYFIRVYLHKLNQKKYIQTGGLKKSNTVCYFEYITDILKLKKWLD